MKILTSVCFISFLSLCSSFPNYFRLRSAFPFISVEKPRIYVEKATNLKNGDKVKLSWSGISNAERTDQIRLYCPTELDDKKMIRTYKHSKHKSIGKEKGSTTVDVFFARSSCHYRYLKKISETEYKRIAVSNEIYFDYDNDDPMQIHISVTNKQDEMRVMWTSGSKSTPCVHYGLSMDKLDQKECGTSTTYTGSDMCEEPAVSTGFINPGFLHDVLLQNLQPSTYYYYTVGNDKKKSTIYKFKSSVPTTADQNNLVPISVDAFGDLDVTKYPGAHGTIGKIADQIKSGNPPHFVLHIGDISYARGFGLIWEEFGELIQPVAAQIPYMVSIGNHEHDHVHGHQNDPSHDGPNFRPSWGNYLYDSGGECSVPMHKRYHMPDNGNSVFWYSFDYGMVHVVQFTQELDFTIGSNQYKWLENDLKMVDRKKTPWVIVTAHRSMYASLESGEKSSVMNHIRMNLEPLFLKYQVDFFMSGHYHFYERTCAIAGQKCVPGLISPSNWGTVHLVVGAGGKKMDEFKLQPNEWSIKAEFKYGHGRMDFANRTHAFWRYIANVDAEPIDSEVYIRDHNF